MHFVEDDTVKACNSAYFSYEILLKLLKILYLARHVFLLNTNNFSYRLIKKVLIREPENRISLEELSKSSWMQAEKPVEEDLVPLVWRQNVKPEDQNDIIHQMVVGKIATKESILK